MSAKPALRTSHAYILIPAGDEQHQDELHRLLDARGWTYRTVVAAEPRDAAVLHEAAESLRAIADAHRVGDTYESGFADGIRYAAGLLGRVADDENTDPE